MGWRTIVIKSRSKLDYKMNYMVVTNIEERKRVFIEEISTIIVESTAVSITAVLINEIIKNKIKLIFCDEKRNPSSELVSYYGSHNTSDCYRKQIHWLEEDKIKIWTMIVEAKIRNQSKYLQKLGKGEYKTLEKYISQIEINDSTNREAHAASVYFRSLFGINFSRNDDNDINASLNYGYSIILSTINREIVSLGYMTQVGLSHDNMFNKFNLSSDLIEPFRVLIDMKVYESEKVFDKEQKMHILSVLSDNIEYDGNTTTVEYAIKRFCKDIVDCMDTSEIDSVVFPKIF